MEFRDIPSCPGYKISKEGVVISPKGKQLKQHNGAVGIYYTRRTSRKVELLLAETWLIDDWKNQLDADEEWKVVDGFDDYIITSKGRVWATKLCKWLKITPQKGRDYYYVVGFSKNGKQYTTNIHRVVGRHFLPEYKEGLKILHKDENLGFPEINYVENLWCGTDTDNANDREVKRRTNRSNRFGFIGVHQSRGNNTYHYTISYKGKKLCKGGFATPEEAHEAYLSKRMELKGY